MLKQIELHGQRFELCSVDGGRTWSSDVRSLIAFRHRQEHVCADLRKRFEEMEDEIPALDPNDIYQLSLPKYAA